MTEDNFALEAAYTSKYTQMRETLRASIRERNPLLKAKLRKEWMDLCKECTKLEERLGLKETTP